MSAAREAWLYTLQIIGPHDAAAPFVPPPLKLRDVLAFHWTPETSPDVRLPMCGVPPFSHNNIRQRQAREATRRARRCPAPARLPTARPAVARARVAGPASRREARSTRTGPQRVDTAEPEPRRRVASAAITSATFKWPRLRRLRSRAGSLADRGASTMSRGHGLPLAAPRATGSPVKRYTAFRVLRRALT